MRSFALQCRYTALRPSFWVSGIATPYGAPGGGAGMIFCASCNATFPLILDMLLSQSSIQQLSLHASCANRFRADRRSFEVVQGAGGGSEDGWKHCVVREDHYSRVSDHISIPLPDPFTKTPTGSSPLVKDCVYGSRSSSWSRRQGIYSTILCAATRGKGTTEE